jgi:uroporphyrinogen-III synthase
MSSEPIAGRRVLVTRPAERAAGLAAAIEAAGGAAVCQPTIEIAPVTPTTEAVAAAQAAVAILFTSPAAVAHGIPALQLDPEAAPALGAVGPATAAELRHHGFAPTIDPVGSHDSEGLLRSPALAAEQVRDRTVVIVRGEGGRAELARGLMARGATVHYAEVYRRERPRAPAAGWAAACDILSATSNEGLANLLAMVDQSERTVLLGRPLAVSSARIAAAARDAGFELEPEVADAAGDDGLLAAIRRCAARLATDRIAPQAPKGPSENA